jgi:hypothetical protein
MKGRQQFPVFGTNGIEKVAGSVVGVVPANIISGDRRFTTGYLMAFLMVRCNIEATQSLFIPIAAWPMFVIEVCCRGNT